MKRRSLIIERRRSDVVRSLNKRRRENPQTQDLTGRWGKGSLPAAWGRSAFRVGFQGPSASTGREPDDDGLRRQTRTGRRVAS